MRSIRYSLHREDPYWVAQCLNVDVSSFGESTIEALVQLKEAVELYFEGGAMDYTEVENVTLGEIEVHA